MTQHFAWNSSLAAAYVVKSIAKRQQWMLSTDVIGMLSSDNTACCLGKHQGSEQVEANSGTYTVVRLLAYAKLRQEGM